MKADSRLVLSCEHGGCQVPPSYRRLFQGRQRLLASHRGCDPGSLDLAEHLAAALSAPLVASTVTRLLVELNRSLGHPQLFSPWTRPLDEATRQAILHQYYEPHRARVAALAAAALSRRHEALHVGIHTFTPVLRGQVRRADVGLLYDPARPLERRWAAAWRGALLQCRPDLIVRRNYPYSGTSDGLTTCLRKQLASSSYAGLELEINQRWHRRGGNAWQQLKTDLAVSLEESLKMLA